MRATVFVLLLAGASAGPIHAQAREHAPLLLRLPANTRALAMGGAFAVGSSDADAVFYNPALSAAAGVSLSMQRYGSASALVSLAGGTDWWAGRIGVGLQSLHYGTTAARLADGFGEAALAEDGPIQASEHVASVAYARRIRGLRLGLTGKVIEQRFDGDRATSAALDASTGITVARINLGLAAQNFGLESDLGSDRLGPPWRITLGAAFAQALPIGPLDLTLAGAASYEADGAFVPGLGVEAGYWPITGRTFFLRAGVRDPAGDGSPLTLGGGFNGDRITIDYAYHGLEGGRPSHRATLRWR